MHERLGAELREGPAGGTHVGPDQLDVGQQVGE
jgi:hypothetical protein